MTESVEERIFWTASNMALLDAIGSEFSDTQPFKGLRIGVSLHIEAKTAVLLETLKHGGADVVAAGNYATTQDDVVAYLIDRGIDARGSGSDDRATHLSVVDSIVDADPDILLDNGADLVARTIATGRTVVGGTEETTSGHMRLDAEFADAVAFPVIVINDSPLKAIAENKHAVGQSTYESFCRITNLMPQGKHFLVVGYGWCGRGIAEYMRANGAQVSVAEVDEIKTLEAALDGFEVGSIPDLIQQADVVITATGAVNVIRGSDILAAKNGVVLANAGHFPTEIDVAALGEVTVENIPLGDALSRHVFADGTFVDLISDGRMMNLTGPYPKGNSIESMDLGFAMQARCLERIALHHEDLPHGTQPVPDDINRQLARAFVEAMQR